MLDSKGVRSDRRGDRRQSPPAGDRLPGRLRHRRRSLGLGQTVAASVGEGAQVVVALHGFLATSGHERAAVPTR
jgi:hypothetical protein